MIVQIQVCRASDRTPVAELVRTIQGDSVTRADADILRADAKHLSRVYCRGFFVEVWAWWPNLGGDAYHRAYVYAGGRTMTAVGF